MKVLISPGYGAGFSTWNSEEMAFDEDLIALFERGCTEEEMVDLCISRGYGKPYMGGFSQLRVVNVPSGTVFYIGEYDGYESIELLNRFHWVVAK